MSVPLSCQLVPHPASFSTGIAGLAVELAVAADGTLCLAYRWRAAPGLLRLPEPRPAGPADGLWQHTCCEAFIAAAGEAGYREFNFSPSGQWAAYAFAGYRSRLDFEFPPTPPTVVFRRAGESCELEAVVPAAWLPPGRRLRIGLAAVLESGDGGLEYRALAHPGERPDFHRPETFVVELPLPPPHF